MTPEEFVKKKKEFDRQLKECLMASFYVETDFVNKKLVLQHKRETIQKQKSDFIKEYLTSKPV